MTKQVAVVTGASSGIGLETALRLARDYQAMVLVARGNENLQLAAAEVGKLGADVLVIEQDLSAPEAAKLVVSKTLERFSRIDVLVNIAGAVAGLDVFEMSDEQWEVGMALKFHGARRLTLAAWESLKISNGAVVFTSGNASENPRAAQVAVGAINAAIEALSKAFSDRGITDGVQVNTVSPGAVMTGRRHAMLEKAAKARGISLDEMKKLFLKTAGISRFGEASEIANLMAFAVSPAARWMTGTVLRMDGGEIKSV
jgi:3-oxoacyl-[acyl-carrier protein] reductase